MLKADYIRNLDTIADMLMSVHRPIKPSVAQMNAISTACALMRLQNVDEHVIATLGYHLNHPEALIFRDSYTMAALRAAYNALDRKIDYMSMNGQYND